MTGGNKSGWAMKALTGSSTGAWLAGVCVACSPLGLDSSWAQEAAPAPSRAQEAPPASAATPQVQITPSLALQETFTDNAARTASGRTSDFITRGLFGLETAIDTGRTKLMARGDVAYDRYARLPALSGWSADADGKGVYSVIRDRLTLEATGTVTNTYASTIDISAVDRSGTTNRVQLAAYNVGPHLNARLGDFADLAAAAQFAQIFYSAADRSRVTALLPADDNIVQAGARADTGARSHLTQLVTTVQLAGDDRGYRSANALQTVYIQAAAPLRVLVRGGYEHIFVPGVTRINAEIVTAGIELAPNDKSRITLEGGRRFGRETWAATADVQLGAKVAITADYSEAFQPDQVYVAGALLDPTGGQLLPTVAPAESRVAPTPYNQASGAQFLPTVVPAGARFVPTLYNQASLNKSARVHATFAGKAQSLQVSTNWADRNFFALRAHDREWVSSATYGRRLTPKLTLTVSGTYARTYASPLYGAGETYAETIGLAYKASASADLELSYAGALSRQRSPGGLTIDEHTVLLAFKKRF
jgi:uncharacterized protein (PEP-CTERM system associated)